MDKTDHLLFMKKRKYSNEHKKAVW